MEYKYTAESGLQLLARLSARPSLNHLDNMLFLEGPSPGNVVQISGNSSVGKSMLLLKFLTKCLLPNKHENFELGGLNAGVILIDTDHNISIIKLVSLMESFLLKSEGASSIQNDMIKKIIDNSLNNLVILKTYSSDQLLMNFNSLGKILSTNTNISLLIVDSISSYYWCDAAKTRSMKKMDYYLKNMMKKLQKCIQEYKIVTIYVKQDYFQSKFSDSGISDNAQLDYKIELKKVDNTGSDLFYALVDTPNTKSCYHYSITEDGFKCNVCGYAGQFEELQKTVQSAHPDVQIKPVVAKVPGSFEIRINETLVYSKLATLAFPDYNNVVQVIGEAVLGEPIRKIEKQQPITDCCVM